MNKVLLSATLYAGLAASAFGGYAKAIAFTTSGYQGSAPLAGFPVLVKLSSSIDGFDYADFGSSTNLVFKDAAGNVIPHEIDTWDTAGTSLVWVRLPSLSSTTTFTMYYCGSETAGNNPAETWAGASYVGVWHMDEADGTVADATGHDLVATPVGDATVGETSVRYTGTDSPVGHARTTGTASVRGYLSIPDYNSFNVGDTFTMSGWVRLVSRSGSTRLFSRKTGYKTTDGWEIEMGSGSDTSFQVRGAARDQNTCAGSFNPGLQNRWTHIALVYDGTACMVYSNGHTLVAGTVTAATDNGLPLSIGCDSDGDEAYVRGAFDECRLLASAASADWIAAEYATVARDAFVTAGAVTDVTPALGAVTVSPSATKATVSGTIASHGAGATSCDVYLALGPSAEALGAAVKIASGITDSFEYAIRNLSANTTYHYGLFATNNAAPAMGAVAFGSFTTEASFDFKRKVEFTVGYTGSGSGGLYDIPVLVRLSADNPAGFRYSDCATDGSDIRFTDEDGKLIPFEIDTWDPSGESLVWVKVPAVAQGETFTMFYKGSPGAANDPHEVWTEYTGVWHLNGLGADTADHSQGLYVNSTAANGIDAHLSTMSIADEAGRFGKAFRVNDSTGPSAGNYNEGGAWVDDAGEGSPLDAGGVFMISGWFKHANWNFNWDKLFFKRMNEGNDADPTGAFISLIGSQVKETKVSVRGSSGANRVRLENASEMREDMIDNWVYLTIVFNGGTCSIYENGALCRSGSLTAAADNDAPLAFGNNVAIAGGATGQQAWNGWIDEVRFLKSAKSADWIAAEYAAMADDAFATAGSVENIGGRRTIIMVQ